MADVICNISLGRIATLAALPAASDAIILVVLEAAGLEADATLRDHDTLAALLAGTSNEQTTLGRKTISASITVVIDDTNNWVDISIPDQVYVAGAGNPTGAVLFCYDGDTGAGDDTNITPMSKHDYTTTPDGSDLTVDVPSVGAMRAAG